LQRAFFAFPAAPNSLVSTIQSAAANIVDPDGRVKITLWPQMATFGKNIPDQIRENIGSSDVLVCDITIQNMNVYYEIGYAIGRGKAIAPVVNTSFGDAEKEILRDGFFDNIGYEKYDNWENLTQHLTNLPDTSLLDLYAKPLNFQQPLFLLDTLRKTDFRNEIVSSIKAAKVFYRSFDPVEIARFSTVAMIGDVSASSGLVIPFLAPHVDGYVRHNIRGAFLAGLGHGLERPVLLLQMQTQEIKDPLDYRELIRSVRSEAEVRELVVQFAKDSLVAAQSISTSKRDRTALQKLTLGSAAAENEFRTLEDYFVETAEFSRTRRGEIGIVTGRKGSGKTAIFFRVRDTFRDQRRNSVVDLKPESHQLSLFRDELLKIADTGIFDHTLTAFWYFVILSELLLRVKKEAEIRAKYDSNALSVVAEIDTAIMNAGIAESGDFTSRINKLSSQVLQEIKRLASLGQKLSAETLTNVVFKDGARQIRGLLEKHTDRRTSLILLLDNIDKGWPAKGLNEFDVRLLRLLLEALQKVKNDLAAKNREFMSVVFLRNDIYELLVDDTPDRGKAALVRIDWTDREKLKQVIFKRLQASSTQKLEFNEVWDRFFTSTVNGRDSFSYFVDHCLMRPRFLINIIEAALANAINRGHSKVEEGDCVDAVRQHSHYLVDDFGFEVRDVSGLDSGILYALVGATQLLTEHEVHDRFRRIGIPEKDLARAFYLMLCYCVLGVCCSDGQDRYIYDFEYSMKRFEAEIRNLKPDVIYVANPAIHVALKNERRTEQPLLL
jgi:hypothetical protein